MKLIDTIQRLGIGYQFEEDIKALLETFSELNFNEDLFTTALGFRLLRHNGYQISPSTFTSLIVLISFCTPLNNYFFHINSYRIE